MAAKSKKSVKAVNINPCDSVFYASTALFRVPIINYKENLCVVGLQCSVYREA